MSTNYGGKVANIANNLPSAGVVNTTTNANPTVVNSLGAHNLSDGDTVRIYDHEGNTGANGEWPITFIDSTHFSIPADTHAGSPAVGGTGHFQSLAVGPVGPVPSDGDDEDAASVNVQLDRLADQTAFLGAAAGFAKVAGQVIFQNAFGPGASWCSLVAATLAASTWTPFGKNASLVPLVPGGGLTSANTGTSTFSCAVDGVNTGDIVEVELETDVQIINSGDYVGLFYAMTLPGTPNPPVLSSFTRLAGSAKGGAAYTGSMRLSGKVIASNTGLFWVAPAYFSTAGGTITSAMTDDTNLIITARRLTSVKQ